MNSGGSNGATEASGPRGKEETSNEMKSKERRHGRGLRVGVKGGQNLGAEIRRTTKRVTSTNKGAGQKVWKGTSRKHRRGSDWWTRG